MTRLKALLLAGGLGTRLRPLTETVPKCLVPVAGKPLLDYWLDALEAAGVDEALINTHHLAGQVRDHIGTSNATRGLRLRETYEPVLLGSAGTVHANRDFADGAEAILVIYADNLSTVDLSALLAFHASHTDPATMALFHTPFPSQCGIATLDAGSRVTAFVEKPKEPTSDLANAGLYVLDPDLWREIADMNAFDFGFDVLPRLVGRMRGFVIDGYHRDIGTPEALAQAEADAPGLFA
jgi:mannose-1-phosphate guanylyltransferase